MNTLKEQLKTGKLFKEGSDLSIAEKEFDFQIIRLQENSIKIITSAVAKAKEEGMVEINNTVMKKAIKEWLS